MQLGAGHYVALFVVSVLGTLAAQYLINNVTSVRQAVGGI